MLTAVCAGRFRAQYVLGKMSVLLILLSLITWVPQLLLFFFQSYLEGSNGFAKIFGWRALSL